MCGDAAVLRGRRKMGACYGGARVMEGKVGLEGVGEGVGKGKVWLKGEGESVGDGKVGSEGEGEGVGAGKADEQDVAGDGEAQGGEGTVGCVVGQLRGVVVLADVA